MGYGDGLLEEWYRKLSGVKIVALDYSATAIERARARCLPGVEVCADSRRFQPAKRFSTIVFNGSLYHIDDYLALMKNLSRMLAS